jgi:glycosyltransferase involved in cell wall biosynthesis
MNPVRVAHILPFSNVGGTEQATLRLAEAAAHCGFENLLYCPAGADELRRLFHQHCFVTACYEQVEPSYTHPVPYLRAVGQLARELRRHSIRIVHCADILAAHYTALAGRLAGAYVVSHVRCEHPEVTSRDRTFLMPVQKYVFVSRNSWKVFGVSVPEAKGEVLYEGIAKVEGSTWSKESARAWYGIAPDADVVGMASRVHPGKDFETLISAAQRMAELNRSCLFLIAGDYEKNATHREHFQRLERLLRETGMAARFVFGGFEDDMARFYAAIDAFVLSSHAEGLPLVILEAMAHEKPVVATDTGGIGELVVDGETGLLVPPGSPDRMAAALVTVLETEAGVRFGRAGCRRAMEAFGVEQFQHRVKELYCGIAKQQGLMGECAPCMPT